MPSVKWKALNSSAEYKTAISSPICIAFIQGAKDGKTDEEISFILETICELRHTGITFVKIDQSLLSNGDLTDNSKIMFFTSGKLIYDWNSLTNLDVIADTISNYTRENTKIKIINLYSQFKYSIQEKLVAVVVYDPVVALQIQPLDCLSISYPGMQFVIVDKNNTAIIHPSVLPDVKIIPSVLLYTIEELITPEPIILEDFETFLEIYGDSYRVSNFKVHGYDIDSLLNEIKATRLRNLKLKANAVSRRNSVKVDSRRNSVSVKHSISNPQRQNSLGNSIEVQLNQKAVLPNIGTSNEGLNAVPVAPLTRLRSSTVGPIHVSSSNPVKSTMDRNGTYRPLTINESTIAECPPSLPDLDSKKRSNTITGTPASNPISSIDQTRIKSNTIVRKSTIKPLKDNGIPSTE